MALGSRPRAVSGHVPRQRCRTQEVRMFHGLFRASLGLALAATFFVASSPGAHAQKLVLTATMDGAQEVPPCPWRPWARGGLSARIETTHGPPPARDKSLTPSFA